MIILEEGVKTITYPIWMDKRKHYFSVDSITGAFAMWAIRQSPYHCPDNLEQAIKELGEALKKKFQFDKAFNFAYLSLDEIRIGLENCFEEIKTIENWNHPKSGHNAQVIFTSRYFSPIPDNDFIDLDALARNIAHTLIQEKLVDED